ncbi:MAG TPA: DUF1131 family protein [Hyphomicrobiales bacterium]|nr:DUF1131 family protein [Hyphomicrobiales bacterium]
MTAARSPAGALAALAAALALAGCVTGGSAPAVTLMAMSEAGVGPINGATPYSDKAIAGALDGFEVRPVQATVNGEVKWILAGFYDGFQTLRFVPDGGRRQVAEVQVVSDLIRGPGGERVGMSFAESGGRRLDCKPGHDEWSGMAVCSDAARRMRYVYAVEAYRGPDGVLPDAATLAEARLVRMVWHAP